MGTPTQRSVTLVLKSGVTLNVEMTDEDLRNLINLMHIGSNDIIQCSKPGSAFSLSSTDNFLEVKTRSVVLVPEIAALEYPFSDAGSLAASKQ